MRRKHVDVFVVLAVFAICVLFVFFAGCSIIPPDVTERNNRAELKGSIDTPYAQAIKDRPQLHKKPIATEELASGRRIIKHIGEYDEHQGMKIDSYSQNEQRWRVVYFLVDADGEVKDWATVLHWYGKSRCLAGNCFRTFQEPPVEKLDEVVRTSTGKTIASWRVEG